MDGQSVYEATQASIRTAIDSGVLDENLSAGPISAILALAGRIDHWHEIVLYAKEDAAETKSRPKVPELDNTAIPTYLNYAKLLKLLPAEGAKADPKTSSALGQLRSVANDE